MRLNIFHKALATTGLLSLVILLAGCPFSSNVPIDEGTVKVDDKIVGNWISTSDKETVNPTYFVVSKDDKFHATAKKMEFSSSDSTYSQTVYHLTFSEVNGETFMNAMEDEGTTFYLYKFNFNEQTSEISTSEVSDYIKETFASSKELKDFIVKNKSNSYFFTNTNDIYIRK
jgi:hypothetical protein